MAIRVLPRRFPVPRHPGPLSNAPARRACGCVSNALMLVAGCLVASAASQGAPLDAGPAANQAAPTASSTARAMPVVLPEALDTQVAVRVQARGAMLVNTDMGAKVTLRDAHSGEVLAQGLTLGNVAGADEALKAAFHTTLSLARPTLVEALVRGPLNYPHATVEMRSTQWVLPGRHVQSGGWVVELPGFVVNITQMPQRVAATDGVVSLTATVQMMCGCPTKPGGNWDSDAYELGAFLLQGNDTVAATSLHYAGEESTFSARLPVTAPGAYEVMVTAWDAATGNAGLTRLPLLVD